MAKEIYRVGSLNKKQAESIRFFLNEYAHVEPAHVKDLVGALVCAPSIRDLCFRRFDYPTLGLVANLTDVENNRALTELMYASNIFDNDGRNTRQVSRAVEAYERLEAELGLEHMRFRNIDCIDYIGAQDAPVNTAQLLRATLDLPRQDGSTPYQMPVNLTVRCFTSDDLTREVAGASRVRVK